MEERNIGFEKLSYPPNFPDRDLVQHFWDVLDKKLWLTYFPVYRICCQHLSTKKPQDRRYKQFWAYWLQCYPSSSTIKNVTFCNNKNYLFEAFLHTLVIKGSYMGWISVRFSCSYPRYDFRFTARLFISLPFLLSLSLLLLLLLKLSFSFVVIFRFTSCLLPVTNWRLMEMTKERQFNSISLKRHTV